MVTTIEKIPDKIELLKDTIETLYSKEGRSKSYIAKLLHVNRQDLAHAITAWQLKEAEPRHHLTPSNKKFLNKHRDLIKSRLDNDIGVNRIADELKVQPGYLYRTIIKYDDVLSKARDDYKLRIKTKAEAKRQTAINKSGREYNIENMPDEEWLPILGYENYLISNFGRVKTFVKHYQRFHLIRPAINCKTGYMYITLFKNYKHHSLNLSRVVAHAFVQGCDDTHNTVNHIDGNKLNNRADNLEWVSQSENNEHAYHALGHPVNKKSAGFRKLLYKDRYEFCTITALAKFMNKSETQVRRYLQNPADHDIKIIR